MVFLTGAHRQRAPEAGAGGAAGGDPKRGRARGLFLADLPRGPPLFLSGLPPGPKKGETTVLGGRFGGFGF